MLSSYYEKKFGIRPCGMWIPERVWDPAFIEDFRRCGMVYTILDDAHLFKAGVRQDDIYGYFMAEDNHSRMAVFPIDRTLRYMIPFKAPGATIDYFRKVSDEKKDPLFIYADDGEKFGEWPWTYKWVYKKGWLDRFFKELTESREWLETVTFSEYLDLCPPKGDVRIPESSYEEMQQWSGGSWMNFLSKYPESSQMHKRMVYVSNKIEGAGQRVKRKEALDEARKELYKAQTNCPYWHGVFGGIYLHHLRNAVYEHLINAEKLIDEVANDCPNKWMEVKNASFPDKEKGSFVFENSNFFIYVDAAHGGVIREFDYKTKSCNLINTLKRQPEPYHKKILERINKEIITPLEPYDAIKTMDRRIKKGIYYDRYERVCLIDHFINKDLRFKDLENCTYPDIGDFAGGDYTGKIEEDKLILRRDGNVEGKSVLIIKRADAYSKHEIKISYTIQNNSGLNLESFFGMEFNISLPQADSARYSYKSGRKRIRRLGKSGFVSGRNDFSIKDSLGEMETGLNFSKAPDKIWYFPVMTVSQSERAYDLSYQSSCIFPIWDIRLARGEKLDFDIIWKVC